MTYISRSSTTITQAKHADRVIHATLAEYGCFASSNDNSECNLDNEIHPLFSLKRWKNVDKHIYATMKPALQLASLWITDDRMLDWYYRNTVGVVRFKPVDGIMVPYLECNKDLEDVEVRQNVRAMWMQKLKQMSEVVTFEFFDARGGDFRYWGTTRPYEKQSSKRSLFRDTIFGPTRDGAEMLDDHVWRYTGKEKPKPKIALSNVFLAFFDRLPFSDLSERLNGMFVLAVTLCHELAHAACVFPRFQHVDPRTGWLVEAFQSLQELEREYRCKEEGGRAEPGFSWEMNTFQDIPHPRVQMASGFQELQARAYRESAFSPFSLLQSSPHWHFSGLVVRPEDDVRVIWTWQDIAKWFRKETWGPNRSREVILKGGDERFWVWVRRPLGMTAPLESLGPDVALEVTVLIESAGTK